MTSRDAGIPESPSPGRGSFSATPRFLGALFALLLAVQVVVYRDSFAVKPSSDDFVALHQIDRGEREGALTFFRASDLLDYRPLQNLTFWLFGRGPDHRALLSLRILHVLSLAFYALVAFAWIRVLGLNRIGAVAAGCVVFLHPALAGAFAGLDNFTRFVVSAWVWLGALVAYRGSRRPLLACLPVCLCFILGLGFMEYAVTLVPLAGLAIVWRGGRRSLRTASILLVALIAILGAYVMIRTSVIVKPISDANHLSLDPLSWIRNSALIAAAVLFFGNTVTVVEEGSLRSLTWLVSNTLLVATALVWGLWSGRRLIIPAAGEQGRTGPPGGTDLPGLARFLGAACAASCFPMVLMSHVSEIYVSAVVLALALLLGLSAHAWATASRPLRLLILVLAGSQLFLAADAIRSKVAGIHSAGERTDAMMRSLLDHLPNDGAPKRVAAIFQQQEGAGHRKYSLFAMPDDELIPQGYGRLAIRWFRPGLDIRLDPLLVADLAEVDSRLYDLVLLWNTANGRFSPFPPAAMRP